MCTWWTARHGTPTRKRILGPPRLPRGRRTAYIDADVAEGTAYACDVLAVNTCGEWEPSATVNVDTSENPLESYTLVDASDQSVLATLSDGGSVALADPDGDS